MTAQCSTHQPEANELQREAEGAGQTRAMLPWAGMCCLSNGREAPPKPLPCSRLAAAVLQAVWHREEV